MKKIGCMIVIFLFCIFAVPEMIHADVVSKEAKVGVFDKEDDIKSKAILSYETTITAEPDTKKEEVFHFTLTQPGYVDMVYHYQGTDEEGFYCSVNSVELYTNEAMTNKVELNIHTLIQNSDTEEIIKLLPKGTYYVKIVHNSIGCSSASHSDWRFSISTIPLSKLLKAQVKVSSTKRSAVISVSTGLRESLRTIQYVPGLVSSKYRLNNSYWSCTSILNKNGYTYSKKVKVLPEGRNSFTVTKNGLYTIRIDNVYQENESNNIAYTIPVRITGLDKTAPIITGVSHRKTYHKAVVVRFRDSQTGIKSAKLNGRTIKSGRKLTRKGKYSLRVQDKAGNTRSIYFYIR